MNHRIKQAILSLLVVGQLALVGCSTPQARIPAPAPTTSTLSIEGVGALLSQAGAWTSAPQQSGLQPVYMGLNLSDGDVVLFYVVFVGALLTLPLWGPFYLIHDWFHQRR